jgi:hypothetical protein
LSRGVVFDGERLRVWLKWRVCLPQWRSSGAGGQGGR